jgi:hypothetical protein
MSIWNRGFFSHFFFPPILLCSHNGDPPHEELAKFGYRLDKSKVDKLLKILLYFGNLLSKNLQFQPKKKFLEI